MKNVLEELLKLLNNGESAVLAVIVRAEGSAPRKVGAKMVIRGDGSAIGTLGGGDLEKRVIEEALNAISEGIPRVISLTLDMDQGGLDMRCGGKVEVYIEPLSSEERLIIFGAGHITRALIPIMVKTGFRVTVVDDNPDLVSREQFPEVEDLRVCDLEEFAGDIMADGRSYVVILSRGYSRDKAILAKVIQKDLRYIGMIGSMSKLRSMIEDLRKEGVPEESFSRLSSPVGLDIGAETPEEIAISIAAEIIAAKKGKLDRFKTAGPKPGARSQGADPSPP